MTSAFLVPLTALFQSNYATLAVITAVGYDYVLTFSDEVEYVWSRPWTWVSILFIIVRYCGLYIAICASIIGGSFLSDSVVKVNLTLSPYHDYECFQGRVLYITSFWSFGLFLGAADFVMLLRVWTMYSRSRPILIALLVLFFVESICTILTLIFNSIPKDVSTSDNQILGYSLCGVQFGTVVLMEVSTIIDLLYGAVMCILVTIQFVRQSLQMYRATKQWQLNRYMNLFIKQGVLYFAAMLLFQLLNAMNALGMLPIVGWQMILLSWILQYVPIYTLTPRFVISMRELYVRDIRRGHGVDSAFGLSSGGVAGGEIVFANVEQNTTAEEIPMETTEDETSWQS